MTPDEELAQDTRRDHARAEARGERLADLSEAIVSALVGHGLLRQPRTARLVVFHLLAEHFYGNRAVDIPARLDAAVPEGGR